jgi:hypothetical protein
MSGFGQVNASSLGALRMRNGHQREANGSFALTQPSGRIDSEARLRLRAPNAGESSERFGAFFDPANAELHELNRVLEIQLFFDARAVGLDRLDADVEFRGNLARGESTADHVHDFQLAITQ